MTQLLFTVVSPYVNFLAMDHPEVTTDKNLFMKSLLVIIIKALFQADSNLDFHLTKCFIASWKAGSGFMKTTSSVTLKKQGRTLIQTLLFYQLGACLSLP